MHVQPDRRRAGHELSRGPHHGSNTGEHPARPAHSSDHKASCPAAAGIISAGRTAKKLSSISRSNFRALVSTASFLTIGAASGGAISNSPDRRICDQANTANPGKIKGTGTQRYHPGTAPARVHAAQPPSAGRISLKLFPPHSKPTAPPARRIQECQMILGMGVLALPALGGDVDCVEREHKENKTHNLSFDGANHCRRPSRTRGRVSTARICVDERF
jgi:hypothetical protein